MLKAAHINIKHWEENSIVLVFTEIDTYLFICYKIITQ